MLGRIQLIWMNYFGPSDEVRFNDQIIKESLNPRLNILQFINSQNRMKKGHRRTNSETIAFSHPMYQRMQKPTRQQQKAFHPYFQFERIKQSPFPFSSIQSLLQKSQSNIAHKVLHIQNLQQPIILSNNTDNFSFGKGANFKLSNSKLNMKEIPEVPKSNQSTSIQGQNKIENRERELYFTYEPVQKYKFRPTRPLKQCFISSPIDQRRKKISSAVNIKQIRILNKIEKNQPKIQAKNTHENQSKENPLKRPKLELKTHKKNVHSFGGANGVSTLTLKTVKQYGYDQPGQNDLKIKRRNLVK